MTKAQSERLAADFVIAFIQQGKIKSYKACVKAYDKIREELVAQDKTMAAKSNEKTASPGTQRRRTRKSPAQK